MGPLHTLPQTDFFFWERLRESLQITNQLLPSPETHRRERDHRQEHQPRANTQSASSSHILWTKDAPKNPQICTSVAIVHVFFFFLRRMKDTQSQNYQSSSHPHVATITNHIRCGWCGSIRTQAGPAIQQRERESLGSAAGKQAPPPSQPRALGADPHDLRLMADLGFGQLEQKVRRLL